MTTTIPVGFPTAATTGVPAGIQLTAYTGPMTITTDGAVIENKIINGALDIAAANVTIKNCVITYNDFFGINVGGANITVENCDIKGPGYNGDSPAAISCDVGGGTFVGNDISGAEHGIVLGPGSSIVRGNYIHDGGSNKADPHIGGISLKGGQNNVIIEDNTVIGGSDATSDIFLQNNWGSISNVAINHNYLAGDPGYNVYVEGRLSGGPVTGISITNNVIITGHYGDFSIVDASPTLSGNVEFPSGSIVTTDPTSPASPGSLPLSAPVIASFSNDTGAAGDGITSDNTLDLKGSAAPGSIVNVYDGATQIGHTTADSSGKWDYITSVLTNATHVLKATSSNSSGQTSAASAALSVTVDNVAPLAPVFKTDTVLETNKVQLSGTAEAGSFVSIHDGSNVVGSGTVDSNGSWSITTSALPTGSHGLTATAKDVAGNVSASSVPLDLAIAPTPQVGGTTQTQILKFSQDSGIAGDHITSDNTLTLSGTASAKSSVKVFDGSTQVGSTIADSSGAWSLTTTALADGKHSLTASATASSSGASPAPALFEDFRPWSGTVSPDGIWRIAGPWTGTGGDTLQPSNVKLTNAYPGETDTGFMSLTTPAGSPLRGAELQSLTTPGYSYGYYEVRMETANVKNGGVASFFWIEQPNYGSHEWDVEFTLSDSWAGTNNPGRVAFTTHPLDNTQWTNLDFNPSQAFHDYGFLWTPGRIDFTVDGKVVRTVTDPALLTSATGYIMMNTWSSGNPNFGGGPPSQDATTVYDWVKFYPNATSVPPEGSSTTSGGATSTSMPLSVTIDTKPPTAPVLKANSVVNTNHVQLSGTAEAGSTLNVYDGTAKVGSGTADATGAWNITTSALSMGTHVLTAKATDAAGNVSAASSAVQPVIGAGAHPPAAPTIKSISNDTGKVGDQITNDQTLSLAGLAVPKSSVKIYDGTSLLGTVSADADGAWKYTTPVLRDGRHDLNAKDTVSGQTSAASAGLMVDIDTRAPAAPKIASDKVTGTKQIVVSGTAEANSTIKVFDGTAQVGTATTNASGAWSVTTSALPVGAHVLRVEATDIAGNTSAASIVDPVISSGSHVPAAPKIKSFSRDSGKVGDHITNDGTVSLSGTAVPKSTVMVYDGKSLLGSVTADAGGGWKYTTTPLPDGMHKFSARDAIAAGTSVPSAVLALTIDTHAPKAPVLSGHTLHDNGTTLTGTAEAGSAVKLYDGSTKLGSANASANGHWSLTADLKPGSHSIIATATDAAGNTGAHSQALKFSGAAVELSKLHQNWDDTVTIKGMADPHSQVKLYDGKVSLGSVTANADGDWSFRTSDLSDKKHSFVAQQVDHAGHVVGESGQAVLGSSRGDKLIGTNSDDILVGRGGPDTFVFAPNFGHDLIKDFAVHGAAHDTLQFGSGTFDSFASVLSHAAQSGHDVVISAGNDTLMLKNTKLGALDSHDFHFA